MACYTAVSLPQQHLTDLSETRSANASAQACPIDMGNMLAGLAAGGDASTDMNASCSSSSASAFTDSVFAELDRLALGSDIAALDDLQHHNSPVATTTPCAAIVTPLRSECSVRLENGPSPSGSRGGSTAEGPHSRADAAGLNTVSPQSSSERGDSTPGICTGRRSAREGTRRFLVANSESEASPPPMQSKRLSSSSPPQSLTPHSTPAATGRQASPPEWMTSARRPARPAAGSPTCSLYNIPAPSAPPGPAHHQEQQRQQPEVESIADSGAHTPSTGSIGWLDRGSSATWMQAPGSCGQATPAPRTTRALVRSAGVWTVACKPAVPMCAHEVQSDHISCDHIVLMLSRR